MTRNSMLPVKPKCVSTLVCWPLIFGRLLHAAMIATSLLRTEEPAASLFAHFDLIRMAASLTPQVWLEAAA